MTQFKDKAGIGDMTEMLKKSLMQVKKYDKLRTKAENIFFSDGNIEEKIKSGKMSRGDYIENVLSPTLLKFVEAADAMQKSTHTLSSAFIEDKKSENVGVGLFDYPVLMAADILLYDTAVVPVGEDQLQHIELTRTLARRFNKRFGDTFIIPKAEIRKEGKRIMGLDNPEKKMSKSAETIYNYIALNDDADVIRKKIRKAVTDSGSEIVYQDDKPALKNLINIYSLLSDKSIPEIEEMYKGKGYGDFKNDLAEVAVEFLVPFQERFNAISDEEVMKILEEGAENVRKIAEEKMKEVKEKVGFLV